MSRVRRLIRRVVPVSIRHALLRLWWRSTRRPAPSSLSGLKPIGKAWGLDRGTPIDRYYIELFLSEYAADVRGRVLEVGDARYTRRFGRAVTKSDVLNLTPGNPEATIVGDLSTGAGLPVEAFDCIIVTNTLRFVYEPRGAMASAARALRPGGVLLAHFSGITPNNTSDWGPPGWNGEGDYWRVTAAAAERLCAEEFGAERVTVRAYGNVRTASAFLYGLAVEDLQPAELGFRDPRFDVVVCVRAVKAGTRE